MKELHSTAASSPAGLARPWAIRLGNAALASVGRLWQVSAIEVCEEPEQVWLRGPVWDEKLDRRLAAMPGAQRFYVHADGQLQSVASLLPKNRLPNGPWQPLRQWLALRLPTAGLAGRSDRRMPLVLVRSTQSAPASVLTVSIDFWVAYATEAPQVRLDRLRFAVAEGGRTVIHGQPLPPLVGQRWVDHQGIVVPAGWHWSPPVDAEIVRQAIGLQSSDLALWQTDGSWERIRATEFVQASRAAVRASSEGFHHAVP